MPRDDALTAVLPDDLVAAVRGAVQAGEFSSDAEALESIVADWHLRRVEDRIATEELRRLVDEGIASGDPVDAEEFFAELRAELQARIDGEAEGRTSAA